MKVAAERMTAREIACRAIFAAQRDGAYVADTLRALRQRAVIEPREAGLAREIALGAVRRQITIDHVLSRVARYEPQRVALELRAILHAAAYQLIWLDRIPEFAAVDEAVSLARHVRGPRAAGMINAVLRSLARAIEQRRADWRRLDATRVRVGWAAACAFKSDVLPVVGEGQRGDALHRHLAAATGERLPRYTALAQRFGAAPAEAAAWASQAVPAVVVQPNRLRISATDFAARVRQELGGEAELSGGMAFVAAGGLALDAPLFEAGLAYIQDSTARAAATLVAARRGERVLDLCAAPGGKSVALALDMGDEGEIVASDVSTERLARVAENAVRLGLKSIRTAASNDISAGKGEAFDAVLVDAPCSNSGVLARRPEARARLTPETLASLSQLQQKLLHRAAELVRPGGRLVYSTCSIEPEENEQVITAFATSHAGWGLESSQLTLPAWGERPSDWRDGGFAARLVRG